MSISFMKLYDRNNHSVGIAFWHIQFCTKYRYKMFSKLEYKNLISACIRRTCAKHDIKILVLNVMPEHVHLVVKTKVSVNPPKVFSSSKVLRHIFSLGFILKPDCVTLEDTFGLKANSLPRSVSLSPMFYINRNIIPCLIS